MFGDLSQVLRTRAHDENPHIAKENENHQTSNCMSELVFPPFSVLVCALQVNCLVTGASNPRVRG